MSAENIMEPQMDIKAGRKEANERLIEGGVKCKMAKCTIFDSSY